MCMICLSTENCFYKMQVTLVSSHNRNKLSSGLDSEDGTLGKNADLS
jgi:hypothetical protein